MEKTKSFNISKNVVMDAWLKVKANRGAAGFDKESIEDYESDLKNNLYKLWNRMSSGCYFPPAVKTVPIPKKAGGVRKLGIPTVGDRIAQMVVKIYLEPILEPHFHEDSYGYRPKKSALDAIAVTRERCWRYDWVLEFDIKGLFDNIPHDLLMKGLNFHTQEKWILLNVERWLKAEIINEEGICEKRGVGVPQGGVISPLLSNLFLHYVFDRWMERNYPSNPICRYADDGLVHCKSKEEAESLLLALHKRFEECGLQIHPMKTRIVYCKDDDRRDKPKDEVKFTFLGYQFRPRLAKNKYGKFFVSFLPAISPEAENAIRKRIRQWKLHCWVDKDIGELSKILRPYIQGWMNYYMKFYPSQMYKVLRYLNTKLIKWAMRKYKGIRRHRRKAQAFLARIAKKKTWFFPHWKQVPITIG